MLNYTTEPKEKNPCWKSLQNKWPAFSTYKLGGGEETIYKISLWKDFQSEANNKISFVRSA